MNQKSSNQNYTTSYQCSIGTLKESTKIIYCHPAYSRTYSNRNLFYFSAINGRIPGQEREQQILAVPDLWEGDSPEKQRHPPHQADALSERYEAVLPVHEMAEE